MDMDEQSTHNQTVKSLLYWRKSKVNGLACVPVVVSLGADKSFSMKTADGAVQFSLPASEASVKFTGWGTMVIMANGKKYDIVGTAAGVSPDPTREQIEEVRTADESDLPLSSGVTKAGAAGAAATAVGGAAGTAASAAGVAAMQYAYQQGVNTLRDWQVLLSDAGAKVTKSSMRYMTYYIVGFVLLLVVFWAIGTYNK